QEGEEVIKAFLASHGDFALAEAPNLPSFVPIAPEGSARILPGLLESEGGLDGFFMTRLVRTG
ncbi:MAG: rRNA (cytosine967-C5)-methyltransferase, partial [Sphingomonadales bacterium]|nr:rRNA (cytosine967-C5)-methyltransferase [Sphingomonadales bacterium]